MTRLIKKEIEIANMVQKKKDLADLFTERRVWQDLIV